MTKFPKAVRADRVKPRKVAWLWQPYIPIRAVTMVDGDPGIGKSHLMLEIAARVTRGDDFYRGKNALGRPRNVLLLSAEDTGPEIIVPRFEKLDGNSHRLFFIDKPFTIDDAGLRHVEQLVREIEPKIIILDPWMTFTTYTDHDKSNKVLEPLNQLTKLAHDHKCAILCVRHFRKSGGKAIEAGLGSISIIGSARSGLMVTYHKDDPEKRALIHNKANWGPEGVTLIFSVGESFAWRGVAYYGKEALALCQMAGTITKRSKAKKIWLSAIKGGAPLTTDVIKIGKEMGISERTMRRAKRELGLKRQKKKGKFSSRWTFKRSG